ncbi:cupin domain-containing protein [Streptomyces sp. NPDC001435]|jgi:quercetin dioxygenase-like cupin family protein|uniref:cupin domain-containing protein n=1 Tax=unclassified Streptomyces TaxID=2593676 RepID=UPI0036965AA2
MSLIVPTFDETVVVREAEAEVIGRAPTTVRLLADSGSTGGALSTQRVTLTQGADGASPHRHDGSAEMFFVLDGAAELLCAEQVVTAGPGDLVVVPPGRPHAFAAVPGCDADLLIVITPGVERFEYFRHLRRVALGEDTPESLVGVQDLYDNHFLHSPAWDAHRRGPER